MITVMWVMAMGAEVKRMSELLKSGAAMLQETCPQCGTPLFRKGSETFCAKCNRPVVIIRNTEDQNRLMSDQILDITEQTLLAKIQQVNTILKTESDPEKMLTYGNAVKTWLDAIGSLRKLKARD
jgi:UPF0148 protein